MKVLLLEPGKLAREADIPDTLEGLQNTVGGLIQAVYPFEAPLAVVCNEEGLLLGLPLNRKIAEDVIIAGACFLCGLSEDSFADLPAQYMEEFGQKFRYPQVFINMGGEILALPYIPEGGDEDE